MEVEIIDLNTQSVRDFYHSHFTKPESAVKSHGEALKRKSDTKRKRSASFENKILKYKNIQSQNSITSKEKYSKEWRRHSYGVVRRAQILDFKENLCSLKQRRQTLDRGVEILCLRDSIVEESFKEIESKTRDDCGDICVDHEKSVESSTKIDQELCSEIKNKTTKKYSDNAEVDHETSVGTSTKISSASIKKRNCDNAEVDHEKFMNASIKISSIGTEKKKPVNKASFRKVIAKKALKTTPHKKASTKQLPAKEALKKAHTKRGPGKKSRGSRKKSNKESVHTLERNGGSENWVVDDEEKIHMFNKNKSFSTDGETSLQQTPGPCKKKKKIKHPRIQCFPVPKGVIVCLSRQSHFALIGLAKLSILSGGLRIMEYELKNTYQIFEIFSSDMSCYLNLKTLECEKSDLGTLERRLKVIKASPETIELILKCHKRQNVIFLLEKSDFNIPPFPQRIFSVDLSSFYDDIPPSLDLESSNNTLKAVGVRLEDDNKISTAFLSGDQRNMMDQIKSKLKTKGECLRVMICGPKGSGKSTLNRLLLNSLLNEVKVVCFLDCDVGQPEFTPSCCVSLTVVNKPLLGPPFTHIRKPSKCCFYGSSSPADDPDGYIMCLRKVVTYYKKNYPHIPLIINTMGFVKSLGINLLIQTVKMLYPTVIAQIEVSQLKLNISGDLINILKEEESWESFKYSSDQHEDAETLEDYNPMCLFTFSSVPKEDHTTDIHPAHHRDLMFSSYMCSHLKIGASLLSQKPIVVPWNQLALLTLPHKVPKYQILLVFNGSPVALCYSDLSKASRPNDNWPWLFEDRPIMECFGFGIVRGIDKDNKCIYIMTPLSLEELANVNTLVKGDLRVPEKLAGKKRHNMPYVDTTIEDADSGHVLKKQRLLRNPTIKPLNFQKWIV